MPHSPNKENVASYASRMNKTPPPPSLVPMQGAPMEKKSLTGTRNRNKRVRFSLSDNVVASISPLRLNADLLPEGGEEILKRMSGRKSSVGSEMSSPNKQPISFPSEEDLLKGPEAHIGRGGGGEGEGGGEGGRGQTSSAILSSPESVTSRHSTASSTTNPLTFATSSFSGFFKPSRSLWDTPSRASPAGTVSPRKSVTTTPGGAERRLFQFKVGNNDEEGSSSRQFDFSTVMSGGGGGADVVTATAVPIPSPRPGDDPMLLSGGTSVVPMSASSFGTDMITPGSGATSTQRSHRRRRRRLSNLQDMEAELYENGASPIRQPPNISAMSPKLKQNFSILPTTIKIGSFKEFFETCLSHLVKLGIDFVALNHVNLDQVAATIAAYSGVDTLSVNQSESISLSMENGVGKILDRIEDNREEVRKLIEFAKRIDGHNNQLVLFNECVSDFEGDWSKFCAEKFEKLVKFAEKKSMTEFNAFLLAIAENQKKNIVNQSELYLAKMESGMNKRFDELDQVSRDCENLKIVLMDLKSQSESEFNKKFHVNSSGEIERIKCDTELELRELDEVYAAKESEIRSVVEEITVIEEECDRRESEYRKNFLKLNQFFSRNGWNVMKETSLFVYVYCCCHMLVFQRAKNNATCLRFEDIVPVKLETNPVYAESHLVFDSEDFQVPAQAIYDVVPIQPQITSFLYEPQTFYNLMNVVTMEIAQWTKIRERLYSVRRKLNSLPNTIKTLVKVNVNYQIEIVIGVRNSTTSGNNSDLPIAVRMMWFDPIIAANQQPINYSNFSYIITDLVAQYFPTLKEEIDARVRESCNVWECESFELLESIVLGVHQAALKTPQVVSVPATLLRE